MIDIYCSEHVKFVPMHDTITDAISDPVDFANFKITEINAASIPEYSIPHQMSSQQVLMISCRTLIPNHRG